MSGLRVSNLRGVAGSAPTFPDGVVVTGVSTATTFDGNLTGNVTGNVVGNVTGDVTGNITGTTGSFSGNVSVGGTLTYNDVTNVDSIGVVTARGGIKVGAGQSISAVSGIITYYGDGSQLQGVESGVSNFVASGTIANGDTIIINTDGTVSSASTSAVTQSAGAGYRSSPGGTGAYTDYAYIGNNKIVAVYADGSNNLYGTAVVGTINGNTITFGTPQVFHSHRANYTSVVYDSGNDRFVISFGDGNQGGATTGNGKSIVCSVNGTTITFGTTTQFHGGNTAWIDSTYDSTSGKIVISFEDASQNWGKVCIGEITAGTTNITFGSDTKYHGNSNVTVSAVQFDPSSNRIFVAFRNWGDNNNCWGVVGTISGTSVSFGTATVTNTTAFGDVTSAYDPNSQRISIAYYDARDNDIGKSYTVSINPSNNTYSASSTTTFSSSVLLGTRHVYDTLAQKYVVFYRDRTAQKAYAKAGTYNSSDNTITWESTQTLVLNEDVNPQTATYDTDNNKPIVGISSASSIVYAHVFTTGRIGTNLTATNYIGIAGEAISNGATGKVTIFGGTNSGQTGLTTAQTYYVQTDGSLSTTAGNPSVVAGTSISSTKILVKA